MMTRLFIYLLAMMTGFSAAEAVRPVSAAPAAADAAVGQLYTTSIVVVAQATNNQAVSAVPFSAAPLVELPDGDVFVGIEPTTPVLRHDVILG
jgi:membrane-associated protease RseP (regulator of RpoE activity)